MLVVKNEENNNEVIKATFKDQLIIKYEKTIVED